MSYRSLIQPTIQCLQIWRIDKSSSQSKSVHTVSTVIHKRDSSIAFIYNKALRTKIENKCLKSMVVCLLDTRI